MKEKIKDENIGRTWRVVHPKACDQCGATHSEENPVREWGNPYDFGTICEDCDRHET